MSRPKSPLLPRDTMMEILLRLPFDSLIRFKVVSKEWKTLIEDPMFHKLYPGNSFNALFIGVKTLYCVKGKGKGNSRNPLFTAHRVPLKLPYNDSYINPQRLNCWGSSNGIACVRASTGHFHFYNLFTGASYTVTNAPFPQHQQSWTGFGYNRYTDDYIIFVAYRNERYPNQNKAWVYSFKSRDWKPFDGFPYGRYFWPANRVGQAATINGALHWLVHKKTKNVIVTYNLHSGGFGEMMVPDACGSRDWPGWLGGDISELNGQLCVFYNTKFDVNGGWGSTCWFELWVMKEYGVGDSWAKLVRIDCSRMRCLPWRLNWQTPIVLHVCEDGRSLVLFVCRYSRRLYWYDINENKIEVLAKATRHKRRTQLKRKSRV